MCAPAWVDEHRVRHELMMGSVVCDRNARAAEALVAAAITPNISRDSRPCAAAGERTGVASPSWTGKR
jgi:hypothetical protein